MRLCHFWNDEVDTHHGVKFDSVFKTLSNFHVCQPGLPACLANDLIEGVVDKSCSVMRFLMKGSFPGESSNKLNTIPTTGVGF